MKKIILFGILLMMAATVFVFSNSTQKSKPKEINEQKKQELISIAKEKFANLRKKGTHLEKGPCLGIIAIGWVADIAHNPRQAVDEKPENQCQEIKNGNAANFIELDTNGNYIRTN